MSVFTLQILVAVAFGAVLVLIFLTAREGIKLRTNSNYEEALHVRYANWTVRMTIIAVILTEFMVRMLHGVQHGALFYVHLGFAIPYLAALLLVKFRYTGLRFPRAHKKWVYTVLILCAGTVGTGYYMLYTLKVP